MDEAPECMKVCQVIDQLRGGGQERVAVTVANALAEHGYVSATLVTRRGGDYESQLHDKVERLIANRRSIFDLAAWFPVIRWLRNHQFDIFHAHTPGSLFYSVFANLITGLNGRVIYHLQMLPPRGTAWRRFAVITIVFLRPFISATIVTNHELRRQLCRWGFDPKRVFCLFNPTYFSATCPTKTPKEGPPVIVMVAQWRPQKDPLTAIRAVKLLRDQGREVELWLAGAEETATLVATARAEIEQLGLSGSVKILGRRNDIPELIGQASLGVLSTHFEGQPVAVIEYAAGGLPVVVSRVEGTQEIVSTENGVYGFREGDAAELASHIVDILENNSANVLGERAYAYMKRHADTAVVTARITEIYLLSGAAKL